MDSPQPANRTSDRRLNAIGKSRHSRNLRGIGFEVEEMMKLFMIIIIGLVVVVIIIGASGGITQLLSDFCARNPNICGTGPGDLMFAKASSDALVTAINCASGNNCNCNPSCTIDVTQYTASSQPSSSGTSSIISGNFATGFQTVINKQNSNTIDISCQGGSCTIKNFQIPQKVSLADEEMDGLGDPLYLLYWQKFPVGEDSSWSGKSTWFTGTGKIMLLAMCVRDALVGIVMPGKIGTKKVATSTLAKEEVEKMVEEGIEKTSGIFSKLGKEETVTGVDKSSLQLVKDVFTGSESGARAYEAIGSGASKETILAWLKSASKTLTVPVEKVTASMNSLKTVINNPYFKTGVQTATYTTLSALAANKEAYQDARVGTQLGKFIDQPNKMVLQQALMYESNVQNTISIPPVEPAQVISDPTKENIAELGRPVMLRKDIKFVGIPVPRFLYNGLVPLYFASPCKADLQVGTAQIYCKSYTYLNGETTCEEPDTAGLFDNPDKNKCGALYTDLDVGSLSKEKDLVSNMGPKSKQAFMTDSSGITIYEPINDITVHMAIKPNIVCCNGIDNGKASNFWIPQENCAKKNGNVVADSECKDENPKKDFMIDSIADANNGAYYVTAVGGSDCEKMTEYNDLYTAVMKGSKFAPDVSGSYICKLPEQVVGSGPNPELTKLFGSSGNNVLAQKVSSISFIASYNNDTGEVGNFYGIEMVLGTTTIIVLKDTNGDGYIDEMGQYYWSTQDTIYRIFDDTNGDGKADSVSSNKCFVDGIVVSADKSAYKDDKDPNFCYSTINPTVYVGTTVTMFAIDAFAKRNPYTFIASIIADCGLYYIQEKVGNQNWPRGG